MWKKKIIPCFTEWSKNIHCLGIMTQTFPVRRKKKSLLHYYNFHLLFGRDIILFFIDSVIIYFLLLFITFHPSSFYYIFLCSSGNITMLHNNNFVLNRTDDGQTSKLYVHTHKRRIFKPFLDKCLE